MNSNNECYICRMAKLMVLSLYDLFFFQVKANLIFSFVHDKDLSINVFERLNSLKRLSLKSININLIFSIFRYKNKFIL